MSNERRRTCSDAAKGSCEFCTGSAPVVGCWWAVEPVPVGASEAVVAVAATGRDGSFKLTLSVRTRGGDFATSQYEAGGGVRGARGGEKATV